MSNNGNGHQDSDGTGRGTDKSGAIKPLSYTASRTIVGRPTNAKVTIMHHTDPSRKHIAVLAYGAEKSIRQLKTYVQNDILRVFGPSSEMVVEPWNLDIWLPADCDIDVNGTWAHLTIGKMKGQVNVAGYAAGTLQIDAMVGGSIHIGGAVEGATYSVLNAKGDVKLFVGGAALNIYSAEMGFLDAEESAGDIKIHGTAESARLTSNYGSIYVQQVDSQPAIYAGRRGNIQVGPKVPPPDHVAYGRG